MTDSDPNAQIQDINHSNKDVMLSWELSLQQAGFLRPDCEF